MYVHASSIFFMDLCIRNYKFLEQKSTAHTVIWLKYFHMLSNNYANTKNSEIIKLALNFSHENYCQIMVLHKMHGSSKH